LKEAEEFSGSKLIFKDEVNTIRDICINYNLVNNFEELAFTAKYINGLLKVLNQAQSIPDVNDTKHIQKDLSANLLKIQEQIRKILTDAAKSVQDQFEEKFLAMNHESMKNLTNLVSDFNIIKKYLNFLKRNP